MTTLSSPAPLPDGLDAAIAAFVRHEHVVVASDFDGVLAPLVDDPSTSRALPGDLEALRALAAVPGTTVALVSGRDLDTLLALTGVDPATEAIVAFGSHGAQSTAATPVALTDAQAALLDRVEALTSEHITRWPGARVERKPAARVVHTRGMDPHEGQASTSEIVAAAAQLDGVHVLPGKDVVELSVVDASKGAAVLGLAEQEGAAVLYLGDDVTDETVFTRLRDGDVGIKVGAGATAAAHRVDDCEAVTRVLAALAAAREHAAQA